MKAPKRLPRYKRLRNFEAQVLLKEYERTGQAIGSLMGKNEAIIGFGLTIMSASLALGIKGGTKEVV